MTERDASPVGFAVAYMTAADERAAAEAAAFCRAPSLYLSSFAALPADIAVALCVKDGALQCVGRLGDGRVGVSSMNPKDDKRFLRRLAAAGHEGATRAFGKRLREGEPCRILDACAGLGGDALLLSAASASHICVEAVERCPPVFLLLRRNVRDSGVVARFGDSAVSILSGDYDAVYLDPMFERSGASPRKEMALLRALVDAYDGGDSEDLFMACKRAAIPRVVAKQKIDAPERADFPVSGSIKGKVARFDVSAFSSSS